MVPSMITQSITFEVTGQDAQSLLSVCQEQNIEPRYAFELSLQEFTKNYQQKADDELRAKKLSRAGGLAKYANPELIPLEEKAIEMAIKETCSVR